MDNGEPSSHWMSGYFLTKPFLTSVMQGYSRKNNIAIDDLLWTFQFWTEQEVKEKWAKMQQEHGLNAGTMTYGLFLEGAKWNQDLYVLEE